jgi:hypothetical protein
MGFEKEAGEVQDLYLERKYDEAAAALPLDFIDRTSLIGPIERITERMQLLSAAGVTTVSVSGLGGALQQKIDTLRALAGALDSAGVGD